MKSTAQPGTIENSRTLFVCLLLAAATLAVYWPIHQHEFINYDDGSYVTANLQVQRGLNLEGIRWAFGTMQAANWHPLTWLSHMLDCQLYGLRPAGHHLTNLLFHTANTLLLFLVLRRMTQTFWPSAFVAALFGIHPLHVESVAWVAERKDVLSTFFGLFALWAYARYVEQSKVQSPKPGVTGVPATYHTSGIAFRVSGFYLLSLLLFAFSLMSKPMLVTLPFLLLLLDYWPLARFQLKTPARLLLEKMPFLALAAASCVLTFLAQGHTGAVASTELLPITARIPNALVAYCAYIGKLLWPVHLAVFYPYPHSRSYVEITAAALFLIAVTAVAWFSRRRWPYVTVGWLWFLGTLVPVIGLVQVGSQSMADRYTYFPCIGLSIALAWSVSTAPNRWRPPQRVLAVTGLLILLLCLDLTRAQVTCWKNSETLFRHAVAVTKGNFLACAKLGEALTASGRQREASVEYHEALRINPSYFPAMYSLGAWLRTNGNAGQALGLFDQAVQLRPKDATAHYNLGIALADHHQINEAIAQYIEALRLDPNFAPAHNNLANLLLSQGEAAEALPHALTAVRLEPDSPPAHLNAGNALFLQERFAEAETQYAAALTLSPGNVEARLNLGKALVNQDKLEAAEPLLKEAARQQPANAEPHQILAAIYSTLKRPKEASHEYASALGLDQDWGEGLNAFAWMLATHPDAQIRNGTQAVQLALRACNLTDRTNAVFVETLAAAYAEVGMFAEAASSQQMACGLNSVHGKIGEAEHARNRLELYRSQKPCREP